MKKIISTLAIMALVSSCTNEMEDSTITGDYNSKITLTAKPFVLDDEEGAATRSVLTRTETSLKFSWKDGEAIGVFPVSPTTNIQAKKTISVTGEGSLTANFDGEGWELKRGNTYSAYSPFNGTMPSETPYTSVPIDMTGQVQNGNASLAHIGDKYDYMYASSVVPTEGNVNFEFDHTCAIAILELTMPVAGTWTSAALTGTGNVFTTSATMNVSTGAVTSISKSNSISLALENVSTTATDKTLTLYMSALPCTTGALTLKVKNSSGTEYSANLATKTLVAGHAYKWKSIIYPEYEGSVIGHKYIDLGLSVKWASCNIGANSPEELGEYFAWGEVEPQAGNEFDWESYRWCNGSASKLTKYCDYSIYGQNGFVDNITTLTSSDDAASSNWGAGWRIPTKEEQDELYNNCTSVWINDFEKTGVSGRLFTSKINAKSIFLPAAGLRYGKRENPNGLGELGAYSSSTLHSQYAYWAYYLSLDPTNVFSSNGDFRCNGFSIRAVCP